MNTKKHIALQKRSIKNKKSLLSVGCYLTQNNKQIMTCPYSGNVKLSTVLKMLINLPKLTPFLVGENKTLFVFNKGWTNDGYVFLLAIKQTNTRIKFVMRCANKLNVDKVYIKQDHLIDADKIIDTFIRVPILLYPDRIFNIKMHEDEPKLNDKTLNKYSLSTCMYTHAAKLPDKFYL